MSPPFARCPVWLMPLLLAVSAQAQSQPQTQTPQSLKPVVVTATRNERPLEEATVPIAVVTREEIEKTHARTLKQALENVPGLQMREVLGKSGYELSLQGLSADQVLVLIDGLPITASTGSTVDLSQYLLADVERIEVVKGASSAQYGSSAMGGVVNVITRRTQAGFGGTVAVDAGSYGSQNDSGNSTSANNRHGRFTLGGGNADWRLALSGDTTDDAGFGLRPDLYPRQGDASRRQQLALRGDWLGSKSGRAWAEASSYTERDTQRYNLFVPPSNIPQRKLENISRDRVSGGAEWRFGNGVRAQVKGVDERYSSHSQGYSNGALVTDRRSSQVMQHVSTQFDLPAWGRQLWMVGTDWHHETLGQTSNGLNELGVVGRAQRTNTEVFVQNNIVLSEGLEVLLGLRAQDDSDFARCHHEAGKAARAVHPVAQRQSAGVGRENCCRCRHTIRRRHQLPGRLRRLPAHDGGGDGSGSAGCHPHNDPEHRGPWRHRALLDAAGVGADAGFQAARIGHHGRLATDRLRPAPAVGHQRSPRQAGECMRGGLQAATRPCWLRCGGSRGTSAP